MDESIEPFPSAEAKICRVCAGSLLTWGTATEMHFGLGDRFAYLECSECGCIQIETVPEDLDRFYPGDYYARAPSIRSTGSPSRLRKAWTDFRLTRRSVARILSGRRYARFDWFRRTGIVRSDPILDVGCGSGRLLRNLHREGFGDLTGIDLQLPISDESEAVDRSKGPRLLRRSLDAHADDSLQPTYRMVMAHHSFEHVEDPRRGFEAFARLVGQEGWLLIRVPIADSWACRHYGVDWVQLDAPRHLHLHTRKSIRRLAEDFGFSVVEIVDDSGPFQIWGSESVRRGVSLIDARRARRWGGPLVAGWLARLRARPLRTRSLGDQACFYLRRNRRDGV